MFELWHRLVKQYKADSRKPFTDVNTDVKWTVRLQDMHAQMMTIKVLTQKIAIAALVLFVIVTIAVSLSRQTPPSAATVLPPGPFNGFSDVQYFPAAPDNKLANETARLKAARKKMQADE